MLHQGKNSSGKGMSSRGERGRRFGGRRREENYEGSEFNDLGEQSQNRSRSSTAGKTKLSWIPQEYMGLVIGRHGANLKEISQKSGAVLERINKSIYMSGSPEAQEQATQMIREIVSPKKIQSMKMLSVPEDCVGAIIGKGGKVLRDIEAETDTKVKIHDHEIEIFARTPEKQSKARLKIKEIISTVLANRDKASTKSVPYIERSCVCEEAEFALKSVVTPYNCSPNESFYRLQLFDEDMLAKDGNAAEVHGNDLTSDLLEILKELHHEKEECSLQLDMWCHFGRVYLRGVDECEVFEGVLFSMDDIESKIKPAAASEKPMWGTRFRNGITKMELEELERNLKETARSPCEDHRWDLSFLTPTYRHVRAKVWLNKTEQDQATADVGNYSFSSTPPVEVRNQLLRVSSEEDENESPTIWLCVPHKRRFAADIIIPGYRFDCRLVLRSNETDASVNQRPHEKEEDQIIADYLSQMQLDNNSGLITLPPEIDNFDITYNRRSLRQTYSYMSASVPCSLTVSKEEETTDKDADCADKYVDIHLHCDKWDELLKEGNWQPEEIVDTLPQFLQFVTSVQRFLRHLDKQPDVELEQS